MESHEPHKENIKAVLRFVDDRLPGNSFICGTWEEGEDDDSNEFEQLRSSIQPGEPPSALKFFAQYNFVKLAKLELTHGVFRQSEDFTFPQEYTCYLPGMKCMSLNLILPTISWSFPVEEEVALNENAGKNLVTFFNVLDCPSLGAFHLKTNEDKYRNSNWEIEVFDFLRTKTQLKLLDLNLGNLLKKRYHMHPFISGLYPLAPIEVLLIQYGVRTHFLDTPLTMHNYWMPLLNHCNLVIVDLKDVPNVTINELEFLIRRNETSLQVLRYQYVFCCAQRSCKFNCDAMKHCTSLREFTLNPGICNEYPRRPLHTMSNFGLIPTTITKLSISNVCLRTCVLRELHNFENLKFLQLFQCGAEYGSGITFDALMDLFELRTLDTLSVGPINLANKDEELKLTEFETSLEGEFIFLRHLLNPPPPERPESLRYVTRYCPIV